MTYVIVITSRHADPDIYGPYPTEAAAKAAMEAAWDALWDQAGDDGGGVEVMPLRPPGSWA